MTAFQAYKLYSGLKLHFETDNYDFFKYQGKSKSINEDAFRNRRDRGFFFKLSRIENLEHYLVANFIRSNGPLWVGELLSEECQNVYYDWRRRMESFTYNFGREYSLFVAYEWERKEEYPSIIKMIQQREINLETALIIEVNYPFIKEMDQHFLWDPVWVNLRRKLIKYKPFLIKYLKEFAGDKYIMRINSHDCSRV